GSASDRRRRRAQRELRDCSGASWERAPCEKWYGKASPPCVTKRPVVCHAPASTPVRGREPPSPHFFSRGYSDAPRRLGRTETSDPPAAGSCLRRRSEVAPRPAAG